LVMFFIAFLKYKGHCCTLSSFASIMILFNF
jgi:hypothetical protein